MSLRSQITADALRESKRVFRDLWNDHRDELEALEVNYDVKVKLKDWSYNFKPVYLCWTKSEVLNKRLFAFQRRESNGLYRMIYEDQWSYDDSLDLLGFAEELVEKARLSCERFMQEVRRLQAEKQIKKVVSVPVGEMVFVDVNNAKKTLDDFWTDIIQKMTSNPAVCDLHVDLPASTPTTHPNSVNYEKRCLSWAREKGKIGWPYELFITHYYGEDNQYRIPYIKWTPSQSLEMLDFSGALIALAKKKSEKFVVNVELKKAQLLKTPHQLTGQALLTYTLDFIKKNPDLHQTHSNVTVGHTFFGWCCKFSGNYSWRNIYEAGDYLKLHSGLVHLLTTNDFSLSQLEAIVEVARKCDLSSDGTDGE